MSVLRRRLALPTEDSLPLSSDDRFKFALQAAKTVVWDLDLQTGMAIRSGSSAGVLGIPSGPGDDFANLVHPDDRLRVDNALEAAYAGAGVYDIEFRVKRPDGELQWLHEIAEVYRDEKGNPTRLCGVTVDVTQWRQIEAKLTREHELLQQLNETLQERATRRARQLAKSATKLKNTEHRFRHFVEGVTDYAIFMLDPSGNIINWNIGAERIKGYAHDEIIGQHFSRFYTEEDRRSGIPQEAISKATTAGKYETEGWRVRKDGTTFWASGVINAIRDQEGELIGFAKITRDLTEKRAAEQRLRQAQKMEGIGQLTGGVAHDFNNLLTVIIGNLENLRRRLREGKFDAAALERAAENAIRGARRAEAVTQRLLAYARQQPLDPKSVDVGHLVTAISDLLRRTLGEQIAVETVLAGGLWRVHADPNQLEVSILNLAVNARDAMPDGGKLTIETANCYLDEQYVAAQAEVPPGQYVMVAISDTGSGMTPGVKAKAFDPFFTTKDVGHGTGLGLSQVYGFVKQSGGHVKIYSEVNEGTTIKIYLPRFHSDDASIAEERVMALPRGTETETILVVEDDHDVRNYACETLRELGYKVLDAENGSAALQLLERHADVHLLLTDVGLPGGMNGRRLAEEAQKRRTDLKILFTTGYARNAIVHGGRLDPGVQLMPKPFTQETLAAKVRDILDTRSAPARILVVEDEALIQMLVTGYLESAGFRVDTVGSATEALNKLRMIPGAVDAVIVDVGLPDRSGDTLVREIRALHPSLPIIVASGRQQSTLRRLFQDEPRIAFVAKPYTDEDLRIALRAIGLLR